VRTTLTLDDDLAERLRRLAARRNQSFKEVVNATLRRGLGRPDPPEGAKSPLEVRTFRSSFRPGVDPARLGQVMDDLESERGGSDR
jgi:hypothetical protein